MTTGSVLIIDDDEVDRYLLKRLLKETKFNLEVFEADDGRSGLEVLCAAESDVANNKELFPPLIVFLDINMPVMRGPEFLEHFAKVREHSLERSCVIMMFSSSERKEDRERALNYEFVKDYLVKGEFSSGDLRQRIQGVIADVNVSS